MNKKKQDQIYKHFKEKDPILFEKMLEVNFDEWISEKQEHTTQNYFVALCRAIVGQQLSGKVARIIFSRFEKLFIKKQITAEKILKKEMQKFRDIGMSWSKVKYIKDLAQKVVKQEIQLSNLKKLTDEQVITELTKVKGIGRWTAEMFLMFVLNREDIFSHGDLGLKKGMEKIYKSKNFSLKKIEKMVAKWSPYKSFASFTLWNTLDNGNPND